MNYVERLLILQSNDPIGVAKHKKKGDVKERCRSNCKQIVKQAVKKIVVDDCKQKKYSQQFDIEVNSMISTKTGSTSPKEKNHRNDCCYLCKNNIKMSASGLKKCEVCLEKVCPECMNLQETLNTAFKFVCQGCSSVVDNQELISKELDQLEEIRKLQYKYDKLKKETQSLVNAYLGYENESKESQKQIDELEQQKKDLKLKWGQAKQGICCSQNQIKYALNKLNLGQKKGVMMEMTQEEHRKVLKLSDQNKFEIQKRDQDCFLQKKISQKMQNLICKEFNNAIIEEDNEQSFATAPSFMKDSSMCVKNNE